MVVSRIYNIGAYKGTGEPQIRAHKDSGSHHCPRAMRPKEGKSKIRKDYTNSFLK